MRNLSGLQRGDSPVQLAPEPCAQSRVNIIYLPSDQLISALDAEDVDQVAGLLQLAQEELLPECLLGGLIVHAEGTDGELHGRDDEVVLGGHGARRRDKGHGGRRGGAERRRGLAAQAGEVVPSGGGLCAAGGELVPHEDLGGDAGVEHGQVGALGAGALEQLVHAGDGLLVAVEDLVHGLRQVLAVGDAVLAEAEALERGVGQLVAVVRVGLQEAGVREAVRVDGGDGGG